MPQYQHDTTWEVYTTDGSQIVVELDVRVHYDYERVSQVIVVREVKALFRKHDKWIELDIPEDFRVLAAKHFDASPTFEDEILKYQDFIARDEVADAKADHIRERRDD